MRSVQRFLASAVIACSLYSVAEATFYGVWTDVGCYSSTDPQALETNMTNMVMIEAKFLSKDTCQKACYAFSVAGTRDGAECWCGNSIKGKQLPSSACNMPCPGYDFDKCGGKDAINIYSQKDYGGSTETAASSISTVLSSSSPSSTTQLATSAAETKQSTDAPKSTTQTAEKPKPTTSSANSTSAAQETGSSKSGAASALDASTGVVVAGLVGLFAALI